MAVVEMSKIRLVGLKKDKAKIMDTLSRTHAFEVRKTSKIKGTVPSDNTENLDNVTAKQARVLFAINFLTNANNDYKDMLKENAKLVKKGKAKPLESTYNPVKLSSSRQIIKVADFYNIINKEDQLLSCIDCLEKISFDNVELNTKINKLKTLNKNLMPFYDCPIKFSQAKEYKHFTVLLAQSSANSPNLDFLNKDKLYYEVYKTLGTSLAIAVKNDELDKLKSALSENAFSISMFNDDQKAKDIIDKNNSQISLYEKTIEENLTKTLSYCKYLMDLKMFYDVLSLEVEKYSAELGFQKTKNTFVLEGWIPTEKAQSVMEEVTLKTENVVSYILPPSTEDEPPTLLDNPKVVKPYESVTNLYSVPSYYEKDPNSIMGIFFFIIFGIMMADAGYGLLLAIGCTLALKFMKLDGGVKDMIALFAMGGVSTIIFGTLFGGFFSIDGIKPLWFNPLQDPIKLLVMSLVIGVIHLMVGYGYQAYYLIKKKKVWSAIFDVGFIYLLVLGVCFMALPMAFSSLPKVFNKIGLWMLIGSLVGIFLTAGREKKGFFSKILGGVSGLYGLVNLFSDVMSYARIFGIALASGAIGLAFNSIVTIVFGIPVVGYPLGIILAVFLHVFNLAIGLLSAYVHNARLQFLEFYGKFYVGDGRLFSPMGENTKFIRFA